MELTRAVDQPLHRRSVLEAVRQSDYLIVHLADSQRLAHGSSDRCRFSTAFSATSRLTRAPTKPPELPEHAGQLVLLRTFSPPSCAARAWPTSRCDENGYLMATVPATSRAACPTIGFIAHVDTSPEMSRRRREADRAPRVRRPRPRAAGRPVRGPAPDRTARLPRRSATTSSPRRARRCSARDDKAGVAEIVAAADYLMRHPEIPHGPIRIGFTPDEEIGRGAERFDVARFGARLRLYARRRRAASWSTRASRPTR